MAIKRLHPVVIKHPNGTYFTQMKGVETRTVTLNKVVLGHENIYRPTFEAVPADRAAQFNTEADARDLMQNPDFGAPDSFAGCTVEPVYE